MLNKYYSLFALLLVVVVVGLQQQLPTRWQHAQTSLKLSATPLTIGVAQLPGKAIDSAHLQLSLVNQQLWLRNISQFKKVLYRTDGQKPWNTVRDYEHDMKMPLQLLWHTQEGTTTLTLNVSEQIAKIVIGQNQTQQHFRFDLERESLFDLQSQQTLPWCDSALSRFIKTLKRSSRTTLIVGGPLRCGNHLGIAQHPAIHLQFKGQTITVKAEQPHVTFVQQSSGTIAPLSNLAVRLPEKGELRLGYATYQYQLVNDTLVVSSLNGAKQSLREPQQDLQAPQIWQKYTVWDLAAKNTLPHIALISLLLFITLAVYGYMKLSIVNKSSILRHSLPQLGLLFALVTVTYGVSLGLGWQLIILTLSSVWCLSRAPLALKILPLCMIVGLHNQVWMSWYSDFDHSIYHLQYKTLPLLQTLFLSLLMSKQLCQLFQPKWTLIWIPHLVCLLVFICFFAMLLQVLFGDEQGVFGLQPLEFCKTVFAMSCGWAIAKLDHYLSPKYISQATVVALFSIGLFSIVLSLMLLIIHELSTIILIFSGALTATFIASYLLSKKSLKRLSVALPLVLLLSFALGCYGAFEYAHKASLQFLPTAQTDRLQAFINRADHQQDRYQIDKALSLIQSAPFWPNLQQAIAIDNTPAIKDDLAFSHFIARFGSSLALVYLAIYLLTVASIACVSALKLSRLLQTPQHYHIHYWLLTGHIAVITLAGMLLCQTTLSLFSQLDLFIVIGQPIAFISTANSHLIFLVLPFFLLHYLLSQQARTNFTAYCITHNSHN